MSIDTAVMTDVSRSADVDDYPRPPSLHWALVLLLTFLTGGLLYVVWIFRQAAWVRRIDPSSQALLVLAAAWPCTAVLPMITLILGAGESGLTLTVLLANLGFWGRGSGHISRCVNPSRRAST